MPKRTKVLKKTKQPLRWPIILCISIVMLAFIFSTASAQTLLMRQSPQCDGFVECSKLFFSSLWSTLTGSPIVSTQAQPEVAVPPTPVPPPGPENQSAVGVVTVGNVQKLLKVEEIYDYGDAEGTRRLNSEGQGSERKDLILQPMGDGSVGIGGTPSDMYKLDVFGPARARRFEGGQLDITGQARVGNLEATTGIQTSMLCLGLNTPRNCLTNIADFSPWKKVSSTDDIYYDGGKVSVFKKPYKYLYNGTTEVGSKTPRCSFDDTQGMDIIQDSPIPFGTATEPYGSICYDVTDNYGGANGNTVSRAFKVVVDILFTATDQGVGIGTDAPVGKLHVAGKKYVLDRNEGAPPDGMDPCGNFNDANTKAINYRCVSIYQSGPSSVSYRIMKVILADHLMVQQGGNVGIGTETPQAPLHVMGANNYGIAIAKGSGGGNTIDGTHENNVNASLYLNAISGKDIYMVLGGGKVGIGTATVDKDTLLAVSGRIEAINSSPEGGNIVLTNPSKTNDNQAKKWALYNMTGVYGDSLQFWNYNQKGCGGGDGSMCNNRLTISDSGNVGIGTATPQGLLDVKGSPRYAYTKPVAGVSSPRCPGDNDNTDNRSAIISEMPRLLVGTKCYDLIWRAPSNEYEIIDGSRFVIDSVGNVGIGTASPGASLQISNTTREITDTCGGKWERDRDVSGIRFKDNPAGVSGGGCGADLAYIAYVSKGQTDRTVLKIVAGNDPRDDRRIEDDIALIPSGNVGIGFEDPEFKLDVFGDINVRSSPPSGSRTSLIKDRQIALAKERIGFDVAELYDTEENVEVGDVLVTSSSERKLKKSSSPYQESIVGIVSGSPAILFEGSQLKMGTSEKGSDHKRRPAVALAGKVSVKVSLENGPIKVGDYLTTSSVPGIAMKATKQGITIGVALEGYAGKGMGEVLIFLNIKEANTAHAIESLLDRIQRIERSLKKK